MNYNEGMNTDQNSLEWQCSSLFTELFLNYDQLTYKHLLRNEYAVKSLATVYSGTSEHPISGREVREILMNTMSSSLLLNNQACAIYSLSFINNSVTSPQLVAGVSNGDGRHKSSKVGSVPLRCFVVVHPLFCTKNHYKVYFCTHTKQCKAL